jgi:rubrerythrin
LDVNNWTIKKILQMGAEMELESFTLYTKLAEKSDYPGAKRLLKKLADEEERHRAYFLKGLENPDYIEVRTLDENVSDLKITDRLINIPLDPKADFPQILKFAAQREKAAYDFYIQVAEIFKGTAWGKIVHIFAKEELNHKKLLEEEYDEITGW